MHTIRPRFRSTHAVFAEEPIEELLGKISSGDAVALSELHRQLFVPLRRTAAFILSDPIEAQDIVQEVFISIWSRTAAFRSGRGCAFAWITTITRYRAIDRWRRRSHYQWTSQASLDDYAAGEEGGNDVSDNSGNKDDYRVIRCAVAALPSKTREVVVLFFFGGLTHVEISAQLGEPLGTVKSRLRRGLIRLRVLLNRSGFEHAS